MMRDTADNAEKTCLSMDRKSRHTGSVNKKKSKKKLQDDFRST